VTRTLTGPSPEAAQADASRRYSRALLDACCGAAAAVLPLERAADASLSAYFRAHAELGQRDRALVADTIYAALRRRRLLERLTGSTGVRRLVLAAWTVLLGANLREVEPLARGDEAGWLRDLKRDAHAPQPFEIECDLPDWLLERLRARFDDAAVLELAQGLLQPAPLDLRVNVAKASREAVLERLRADGMNAEPTPFSADGVRIAGRPSIHRHPLFAEGAVEVQDEGSQIVCRLVAPRRGEMVVDFCAGAGGKTLALGALMRSSGRLYAFDVSEGRLAKLKPRLARSGLSNVHPQRLAGENDVRVKRLAGKIDRVLVDAPCTGLGTLRRNPDLKWRQKPGDVDELAAKQRAILESAARLVKPGGRLVYATCSILDEENRQVVEPFLERRPEFVLLPAGEALAAEHVALEAERHLELWPHRHGTDGFFAAVLERKER
jgi:16S rRNA (cytosine967-C5)-methyltransferase